MTGILQVPRSRGALSGVLLVMLGAWGAAGHEVLLAVTHDAIGDIEADIAAAVE